MLVMQLNGFGYTEFKETLNKHLFGETLRKLLESLIRSPERFVGLFRPSTPEEKLLQHLTQSREVKFGDAMEEIFRKILIASGLKPFALPNSQLKCDQLFETEDEGNSQIVLIEQKVRDDHDSSKRKGQFQNFSEKVRALVDSTEPTKSIHAIMYFLDPEMRKNSGYYNKKIEEYKKSKENNASTSERLTVKLLYGEELLSYLFHDVRVQLCASWDDLCKWLRDWKKGLSERSIFQPFSEEEILGIAKTHRPLFLRLVDRENLWQEGIIQALLPIETAEKIIAEMEPEYRPKFESLVSKYYIRRGNHAEPATQ